MFSRLRPPRLTLGWLMAIMVPLAAHGALLRQLLVDHQGISVLVDLLWVGLLALSGAVFAFERRASFLGGVVQLTTSPLALLVPLWAIKRSALVDGPIIGMIWLAVILVATVSFPLRHYSHPARLAAGVGPILFEAIEAGLATVGLVLLVTLLVVVVVMLL